jgi:predicted ATPase/DNA-binding winged helix-turn-helix (wHTH) protein
MIKIGRVEVSLELREIFLEGTPLRVGARAFDVLEVLINARGNLVTKDEIFNQVWPDTVVEDNNLAVHVSSLRKLLGEGKDFIKTIPGRGYLLVQTQDSDRVPYPQSSEQAAVSQCAIPSNIPLRFTPLIGREPMVHEVNHALDASRLVTLVGTGGIGKTQLGLEVARSQLSLSQEVRFVALSPVEHPKSTLGAIADGLAIDRSGGSTTDEDIVKAIGNRRLLIVLDNCEHVIYEAASICERLLQANPNLRILATSREPLRARLELLYRVPPLDIPSEDAAHDDILMCTGVQMFIACARAREPRFLTDNESIGLIGKICRRLDGLPLALELAAARATALGTIELLVNLGEQFSVLTGGLRTAQAALDWSYQLLCNQERTVLRRIGVFRGSFKLHAACEIAARDDLSPDDVMEGIAGLASKSLLMFGSSGSLMSYYLLETTRAYALQKLDEAGETDMMADRHARYLRSHKNTALERGMVAASQANES